MPSVKSDVEFKIYDIPNPTVRRPVKVTLGCHIDGVALPRPDLYDRDTMVAGVCKRFATAVPDSDPAVLREFQAFVRTWIRENLQPLPADSDVTFDTWLAGTNYPQWRRDELRRKWDAMEDTSDPSIFEVASFMKDEDYLEYKHGRGINSRSDEFKCLVGPIFKLIEEQVYQNPSFIKHVPVAERPAYITEMLAMPGVQYLASDYTSFEALFVAALMEVCEFELYAYMTENLAESSWFRSICKEVLAGKNECHFKLFTVWLNAVRMSGEMCTSLGNGFTNLMAMIFVCMRKGSTLVKGVVEGDDGLFAINGPIPTSEDFKRLGLVIKLEVHQNLSTASFCGIVFDEVDLVNIADPRKILAGFGWGSSKFLNARPKILSALLRCKALSLLHQYPGAPVIQELALYGLRATGDIARCKTLRVANCRSTFDEWHRKQILEALDAPPVARQVPINTRYLMEEKFGLRVADQLAIEKYLSGLKVLVPLKIDRELFPHQWVHYWDTYVSDDVGDAPALSVPSLGESIYSLFVPTENGRLIPKSARSQPLVSKVRDVSTPPSSVSERQRT